MSEALDKPFDNFHRLKPEKLEEMRATDQHLAGLEHDAWQPCLATEADVPSDKNTRKRVEDAAADQAKNGDSCSAKKADPDPMRPTSFGDDSTEPPALPCRDNVMVDKGAAAPKPCLSPVAMRTLTAAVASTATRAIFHRLPLWFCPTEEMNFRMTSIQYATYYSSFWKVLETKSRQTLVFDPGGGTGRLRAC